MFSFMHSYPLCEPFNIFSLSKNDHNLDSFSNTLFDRDKKINKIDEKITCKLVDHIGSSSLITPTDSSPPFCTLTNISGINHGPSLSPSTKLNRQIAKLM